MMANRKTYRKLMSICEVQSTLGMALAEERGLKKEQLQAVEMDLMVIVKDDRVQQVRIEMTVDE